jgi:hypothetical protein
LTAFLSEGKYFNSRAYMIRYQEEEVELNDMCNFRMLLPDLGSENQPDVFLECELMFSDLQAHGGPDKYQQPAQLKEIPFDKLEPKFVSTKKYQLRQLENGIFEYVPIVFEEQHFCVTLCTLHSTLMDF